MHEQYTDFQRRVVDYFDLPKCERCKLPAPSEFVDPWYWEAGQRLCDDCGMALRNGRNPHDTRIRSTRGPRRDADGRFVKAS